MPSKSVLKKTLSPELFQQVEDALGDDFDWDTDADTVPRSRLNKVIKQRNDLRKQAKASTQAKGEEEDDDDDDDDFYDDGDTGTGKKSSATGKKSGSTKTLADLKEQHEKELLDLKIQYAALDTLRESGARDPQLLWDSKHIDKSKVLLDDRGALTGLKEQVDTLKKEATTGYLFQTRGSQGQQQFGTGRQGTGGSDDEGKGNLDARLNANLGRYGLSPTQSNGDNNN